MEKIVCFLYGNSSNFKLKKNNSIDECKEFNENLLKLKEINGADKLIFSLATNDSYEEIRDAKQRLSVFFDKSIVNGRNFFECGYIENWSVGLQACGKCGSIIDYLNEVNKKYEIRHIYYLDNSDFSKDLVSSFINDMHLDSLYTYASLENIDTLKNTNKLLASFFDTKKMVKK